MNADMGRKYRAYPTEAQGQDLVGWGHTVRALWNIAREQRIHACRQPGSPAARCVRPSSADTSQTCADCGRIDPESRKGCGRLFACVHCGQEDDTDRNASLGIEARARQAGGSVTNGTRSTPEVRVLAQRERRTREAPPAACG